MKNAIYIQYNHSRRSNRYSIEYNKKKHRFRGAKNEKNMNKPVIDYSSSSLSHSSS